MKSSYGDLPLDCSTGRLEREEGELSPSPEAEERHTNNASGDSTQAEKILCNNASNHVLGNQGGEDEDMEYDGEAEGEHCADVDDGEESAQKTGEDSENASDPGEDVSGTESGDGDDSPEDREDEEDEEEQQEGENESEGEAEVVADAHDAQRNEISLTSWDRLLLSCMPLTAHDPSTAAKSTFGRDNRVFYGNDTLYVLFRLHQV